MERNEKIELLANYAHEAWSGWMEYLFSKADVNEDGSWTMPVYFVERWQRQLATKYADLSEGEKTSDREEAEKILTLMENML